MLDYLSDQMELPEELEELRVMGRNMDRDNTNTNFIERGVKMKGW